MAASLDIIEGTVLGIQVHDSVAGGQYHDPYAQKIPEARLLLAKADGQLLAACGTQEDMELLLRTRDASSAASSIVEKKVILQGVTPGRGVGSVKWSAWRFVRHGLVQSSKVMSERAVEFGEVQSVGVYSLWVTAEGGDMCGG